MLVKVRVEPNAKQARVTKTGEDSFEIRVDERAVDGRANRRLREILAEHFNVSKSKIVLVKGAKSRDKIVEIDLG